MLDHQGQISILATEARGPAYVSTIISYDATDIMDNDNLATALSDQIQISIALIGTVRKLSVQPMSWLKDGE